LIKKSLFCGAEVGTMKKRKITEDSVKETIKISLRRLKTQPESGRLLTYSKPHSPEYKDISPKFESQRVNRSLYLELSNIKFSIS